MLACGPEVVGGEGDREAHCVAWESDERSARDGLAVAEEDQAEAHDEGETVNCDGGVKVSPVERG